MGEKMAVDYTVVLGDGECQSTWYGEEGGWLW